MGMGYQQLCIRLQMRNSGKQERRGCYSFPVFLLSSFNLLGLRLRRAVSYVVKLDTFRCLFLGWFV